MVPDLQWLFREHPIGAVAATHLFPYRVIKSFLLFVLSTRLAVLPTLPSSKFFGLQLAHGSRKRKRRVFVPPLGSKIAKGDC